MRFVMSNYDNSTRIKLTDSRQLTTSSTRSDGPWNEAVKEYKSKIKEKEWELINAAGSCEDLFADLEKLKSKYNTRFLAKVLERLGPVCAHITVFMNVVSSFTQAEPTIGIAVWGSVSFVLNIVAQSHRITETVLDLLERMTEDLPRFRRMWNLFPMSKDLEKCLVSVYQSFMEFYVVIITYFRTHPIRNLAAQLWSSLAKKLNTKAQRVRDLTANVTKEVSVASLEADKARFETIENLLAKSPIVKYANQSGPVHHIPFPENTQFVGRSAELQEMHRILKPNSPVPNINGRHQRAFVVHALGGMGKSETALRYVHLHRDEYWIILWVSAETEQKTHASFFEIAILLELETDGQDNDEAKTRNNVVRLLNNINSPWLIVFDNVPEESYSFIRDFWPVSNMGSTLITTRSSCFGHQFGIPTGCCLCLEPLDETSSIQLLLGHLTEKVADDDTIAVARTIVHKLGNLPVAVSQIAGYIVESGCTLSRFLALYEGCENIKILHSSSVPGSTMSYRHTIATVWSMTFAELQAKAPEAMSTLNLLSFLDSDGIPSALLACVPSGTELPTRFKFLKSLLAYQESMRMLQRYNLIRTDRAKEKVGVHRLVQSSSFHQLDQAQQQETFLTVVKLLGQVFPCRKMMNSNGIQKIKTQGEAYLSHVLAAITRGKDIGMITGDTSPLTSLIGDLFWYLNLRGFYNTALPLYGIAREIYERDENSNLLQLVNLESKFGNMYRNSNMAQEAYGHFNQEIVWIEKAVNLGIINDTHQKVAGAYMHIGTAALQLGKLEESHGWHEKCIRLRQSFHGQDSHELALAYLNMGWCLWRMGRLSDASNILERSLSTTQSTLAEKSNDYHAQRVTTYAMRALGNVRIGQAQFDDAFSLHKRAFEGHVKIWGENHFETGVLCHRMAWHYSHFGELAETIRYLRAALGVFACAPVNVDAQRCPSKYFLASVLTSTGEVEDGAKLLEEALAERKAFTGEGFLEVATEEDFDKIVPYWAW